VVLRSRYARAAIQLRGAVPVEDRLRFLGRVAFAAIVLEGFEEELGVGGLLEESSSVPGLGADEEGSVACCSGGDSHDLTKHTSGAKVSCWWRGYGTTEVVPLRVSCWGLGLGG